MRGYIRILPAVIAVCGLVNLPVIANGSEMDKNSVLSELASTGSAQMEENIPLDTPGASDRGLVKPDFLYTPPKITPRETRRITQEELLNQQEAATPGKRTGDSADRQGNNWRAKAKAASETIIVDAPLPSLANLDRYAEAPFDEFFPQELKAGLYRVKVDNKTAYQIPKPVPGGTAVGKYDPALEAYYAQKLEWKKELTTASGYEFYTAYLIVPLDYSDPQGATIALKMGKWQGPKRVASKGNLVYNFGGPGISGVDNLREMAENFQNGRYNAITPEKYNFISFDPRGVGNSVPQIRCESTGLSLAAESATLENGTITNARVDQISKYITDKCYTNSTRGYVGIDGNKFINNVGTVNVIRDLDIIRSVIGDSHLNYLGFSYGSEIGYYYLQEFGANAGTFVLDGIVSPFKNSEIAQDLKAYYPLSAEQDLHSQLYGADEALRKYLYWCLQESSNDSNFTCPFSSSDTSTLNPTQEEQEYAYNLLTTAIRNAWGGKQYFYYSDAKTIQGQAVQLKYPISHAMVLYGIRNAIYHPDNWKNLTYALETLILDQDYRDLAEFIGFDLQGLEPYYGAGGKNLQAAFRTIDCIDHKLPQSSDTATNTAAYIQGSYRVAPFTRPPAPKISGNHSACYYYRVPQGTLPKAKLVPRQENTLIISSTEDPATQYAAGPLVAKALNGTLLISAYAGHCSYGTVPCATRITNQFFADPQGFRERVKKGEFVSSPYLGTNPTLTKNVFSQAITASQCQLFDFNPDGLKPEIPNNAPDPGSSSGNNSETNPTPSNPPSSECTAPFIDVGKNNPFLKDICWFKAQKITTGYKDGTFRGHDPVERAAMAAFLYRLAGSPNVSLPKVSPFRDVATSNLFYREIIWLKNSRITTGYADGSFKPNDPISREAMAAFLHRYYTIGERKAPVLKQPAKQYWDTNKSIFASDIAWLSATGITTGYADGSYRPLAPIERQAMAAFLHRGETGAKVGS